MRRVLFLLACLVSSPRLAFAQGAATEPASRTLSFKWAAPPACPGADAVLARVAKLIGQQVEASPNSELSVQAAVSFVQGSAFSLRMSWSGEGGTTTRNISARSCDEIADAAALFIAFSLAPDQVAKEGGAGSTAPDSSEPDATGANAALSKSSEAAVKPPARPEPPESPEPRETGGSVGRDAASSPRAQPPPLHLELGAYSALWLARLPKASVGLVVSAALSRGPWTLSGGLGAFAPRSVTAAAGSVGAELWLSSFKLDMAYRFELGSGLHLAPLFGADLELMHGSGTGALLPQGGYTMIVGLEAGMRLTLFLTSRWALLAHGELSVLTSRPSFYVEGGGEVFRPTRAGTQLGLGAEMRL